MTKRNSYFLIAVSNRENLDLCIKHNMAGFPSSKNGVWSYEDIKVGDFVSFLYGAKIFNLYRVKEKFAILDAEKAPPWDLIHFRSGKVYSFPFRLILEPIRSLTESLVRVEFAYVAENLLLRGGYRKTHFQADQTTLQYVSQMGDIYSRPFKVLDLTSFKRYTPRFVFNGSESPPQIYKFFEKILQAAIREFLSNHKNLLTFLNLLNVSEITPENLEVLAEKAFPEGHIDLLIKEAIPMGISRKIIIEVKKETSSPEDVRQLMGYVQEIKEECMAGVLIARRHPSSVRKFVAQKQKIHLVEYSFDLGRLEENVSYTFKELVNNLAFNSV